MEKDQILLENVREYVQEANEALEKKHYNSAVTLYFKALAVLTDWYILKKRGIIPSNHSERFQILREEYPEVYALLDKDFPIYQNSYKLKLDLNYALVLKNDFKRLNQICQTNLNI